MKSRWEVDENYYNAKVLEEEAKGNKQHNIYKISDSSTCQYRLWSVLYLNGNKRKLREQTWNIHILILYRDELKYYLHFNLFVLIFSWKWLFEFNFSFDTFKVLN